MRIDFRVMAVLALAAGCNQATTTNTTATFDGTTGVSALDVAAAPDVAVPWACTPCVEKADCGGGWCVQYGADSYCAADCATTACGAGLVCSDLATEAGQAVKACVPAENSCGQDTALAPDDTVADATPNPDSVADATPAPTCADFDSPATASCCKGCSGTSCQPNGCFGGWVCNHVACKCVAVPDPGLCPVADVTSQPEVDASAAVDAGPLKPLTAQGGTLAALKFAIVGDTRPALPGDTAGYPTAIITKIWQDVQGTGVPFAVTTGDYIFSTKNSNEGAAQLKLYLTAASNFTGMRYPALGNHECTSKTDSNCGVGNKDGEPKNYTSYRDLMLAPLGLTKPYYTMQMAGADGSWTAKFVVVAGNAWDAAQGAWLEGELAKPSTYTFVIRHEPIGADTAPGVIPSETIIVKHPLTMRIVGHTHTYYHKAGSQEVVVGLGGAPLSGSFNYGYVIAERRADAAIEFRGYDYNNGKQFAQFAVKADGSPAP